MKILNNEFWEKQLIGGIVILLVSIWLFNKNNPNSSNVNSNKNNISPTIQVEKIEVKTTVSKDNIKGIESKITPKNTATPSAAVTEIPTSTIIPATNTPIPLPTKTPYIPPPTSTQAPIYNTPTTAVNTNSCNCARTCPSMTCEEAYYQLNVCGCSARDGDNDGIPCEAQCR